MKSISLYVANNSYLTKLHPFTKLLYIAAAVSIPLLSGRLWMFCTWIGVSLIILTSGKLLRKTFPLIAFSFTILLTIFLIHGLFHTGNTTVIFSIGPLHFYKEGVLYSAKIGLNILNMLLNYIFLSVISIPNLTISFSLSCSLFKYKYPIKASKPVACL